MNDKNALRELMKKRRDSLTSSDVKDRSLKIFSNVLSLPAFFSADVVHSYVSSKNNEADTHDLIRWLLKEKKRVVVPIVDMKLKSMRHSEIFSLSELAVSSHGIFEPKMERIVRASEIEVVLVPAVAVDRRGFRIGFGGGFYDRFLHDMQLPTIALAYDFQVVESVPNENHDHPVSFIVTDTEIIRCRKGETIA